MHAMTWQTFAGTNFCMFHKFWAYSHKFIPQNILLKSIPERLISRKCLRLVNIKNVDVIFSFIVTIPIIYKKILVIGFIKSFFTLYLFYWFVYESSQKFRSFLTSQQFVAVKVCALKVYAKSNIALSNSILYFSANAPL